LNNNIKLDNFINNANIIHNNYYEYSNVIFKKSILKVEIICPKHGVFLQSPANHLKGRGCRECFLCKRKRNTAFFIKKSISRHGNLYDYSNSAYVAHNVKVDIICRIHGVFSQLPYAHMRGAGCIPCSRISSSKKLTHNKNIFIEKCIAAHNNKYDYSLVDYSGSQKYIKIICGIHGVFSQKASSHLIGKGCKKCAIVNQSLTNDDFVRKCTFIHKNKYDYSKTQYTLSKNKVLIICKVHGEFKQYASSHLCGSGCAKCKHFVSKKETAWLDYLNVENKYRSISIKLNNKRYNVDAFNPQTNTIYEFYGDYWHGNPKIFEIDRVHPTNKNVTFGDLFLSTMMREYELKQHFNVVSVWENEFKQKMEIV
jgi:hypothetical protein